MDGINFNITGNLVGKFEETVKEMPHIEKLALYRAAYYMRDQIRHELLAKIPKANTRNPKYTDTLVDAVGFTRPDGGSLIVNALGTNETGSGTFRTRFFEKGTQERFQNKRNGIKLKKKKSIGRITARPFFQGAVRASESATVDIMRNTISKYVQETING